MSGVSLALSGMRFVALVTAGVILLTAAGLAIGQLDGGDPSPLDTPLTVATQPEASPTTPSPSSASVADAPTPTATVEPTPTFEGVMLPQLSRDD